MPRLCRICIGKFLTTAGSMKLRNMLAFSAAVLCFTSAGLIVRAGAAVPAGTQESPAAPNAGIVRARGFVSLEPVPRGKQFQVAVVVDIAHGYHMNSHKPSDEYLIPTTLTPKLLSGVELLDTIYPAGRQQKFSFSPDKPLDVYSGSVTLKLRLSAKSDAPVGTVTIPLTLRYQACNDTTCLPPVKLPVDVKFEIAPANAKAHPDHPEIFSAAGSSK
jgi:thiol:disulfide interchange protein DsbD